MNRQSKSSTKISALTLPTTKTTKTTKKSLKSTPSQNFTTLKTSNSLLHTHTNDSNITNPHSSPISTQKRFMGLKRPTFTPPTPSADTPSEPSYHKTTQSSSTSSFGNEFDSDRTKFGNFDQQNDNFDKKFDFSSADKRMKSQLNKIHRNQGDNNFSPHGNDDSFDHARYNNKQFKKKDEFGFQNNDFKKTNFFDSKKSHHFDKNSTPYKQNFVNKSVQDFNKALATNLLRSTETQIDDRTKRFQDGANKDKQLVYNKMKKDDERFEAAEAKERNRQGRPISRQEEYQSRQYNHALTPKQQRDRRLKEIKQIENKKKTNFESS